MSSTPTPSTLSSGRKKPQCRYCGMPMEGHRGNPRVCPSELVAYNDVLPVRSRTKRATTQVPVTSRSISQARRRTRARDTITWAPSDFGGERMSGTLATDEELMHAQPRMATWVQLAFSGAVGGLVVLLGFIAWATMYEPKE